MSESAGQRGYTVGIAGFGTVGQAVARILSNGTHPGLRLTHVCNRNIARKQVDWVASDVVWTESFDELVDSSVDVVVELIGGLSPAREWIGRALRAGKSVVTANKQVIAHAGPQLLAQAGEQGRHLLFEAAVAGGIPIVRVLRDGVSGDRLYRIQGILNGTCNYILTRMEHEQVSFRRRAGRGAAARLRRGGPDGRCRRVRRAGQARDSDRGGAGPRGAGRRYPAALDFPDRHGRFPVCEAARMCDQTGGPRRADPGHRGRPCRGAPGPRARDVGAGDGSGAARTSWSSMGSSVARLRSRGVGLEESPPRWRWSRTCWGSRVGRR